MSLKTSDRVTLSQSVSLFKYFDLVNQLMIMMKFFLSTEGKKQHITYGIIK